MSKSDYFIHGEPIPMNMENDYLEYLVAYQVNQAMGQFFSLYSRSFGKLENAILGELLPRLRYTKKGHGRLVRKVMRRLEKLRPFAQNPHKESYEQIIRDWKSESVKNQERTQTHKNKNKRNDYNDYEDKKRDMDKKLARDKRKYMKHLRKQEEEKQMYCGSPINVPLHYEPRSTRLQSCIDSSTQSSSMEMMQQPKGMHSKSQDVKYIYQNDAFPTVPMSDIELTYDESPSDGSIRNISSDESPRREHNKYDKRALKANLMYEKSLYSLHMMRHKFPPSWKYYYDHKLRLMPNSRPDNPSMVGNDFHYP